jgi:hypothetical protein
MMEVLVMVEHLNLSAFKLRTTEVASLYMRVAKFRQRANQGMCQ